MNKYNNSAISNTALEYVFCLSCLADPASGGSFDWAKGKLDVKYAFVVELRPKSMWDGGFVLPPSEITPCGEENWVGLKALLDDISK